MRESKPQRFRGNHSWCMKMLFHRKYSAPVFNALLDFPGKLDNVEGSCEPTLGLGLSDRFNMINCTCDSCNECIACSLVRNCRTEHMAPKRKHEKARIEALSLSERKHTRFDVDTDSEKRPTASTGPSTFNRIQEAAHPNYNAELRPRTHLILDGSPSSYILDLAINSSSDRLAVGSDHGVQACIIGTSSLSPCGQRFGLKGTVTSVGFVPDTSSTFYACNGNGEVGCWDLRQKRECHRYLLPGHQDFMLTGWQLSTYSMIL